MPDDNSLSLDTGTAATVGQNVRRSQHLSVKNYVSCQIVQTPPRLFSMWGRKFEIYTKTLNANDDEKLDILINRLDFTPYEYVDKAKSYKEAMDKLESIYNKKINKILAR